MTALADVLLVIAVWSVGSWACYRLLAQDRASRTTPGVPGQRPAPETAPLPARPAATCVVSIDGAGTRRATTWVHRVAAHG